MSRPRAVIFGCAGLTLSQAEKDFFKRTQPLGFILFERNIESPDQVRELVHELRASIENPKAPVLIDQEGGRVARLKPPHWRLPPPASIFGNLAEDEPKIAARAVRDNSWLIGQDLQELGISVDCAPCADLLSLNTHPIIGDRAFGNSAEITATLALQAIHGFLEAGITPVLKHIPGHGRASEDTHENFAPVRTAQQELMKTDFRVFRLVIDYLHLTFPFYSPWAMTAHITYTDIDDDMPATHSPTIIDGVIRGNIGFKGFLISDCITMKALGGSLASRAKKAIEAGCDAVLHCSGKLTEMIEVAPEVKPLSEDSLQRLEMSYRSPLPLRQDDVQAITRSLNQILTPLRHEFNLGE